MLDVAKNWLGEAFDLDEKKELKLMANPSHGSGVQSANLFGEFVPDGRG
jgi:hypothetical protein